MKSEPESFSIQDLARLPEQTSPWDGVRNYQARNFMRDAMRVGDRVLFYHSNCAQPGVVGTARVASGPRPDLTAQDPASPAFDPKASAQNPSWVVVNIQLERIFSRPVTLAAMRQTPALAAMRLLQKGNRLSVMPVEAEAFETIVNMGL